MVNITLDSIFIFLIMQCVFWDIKKRIIPNKINIAIFSTALVKAVYIAILYAFFNQHANLDIAEYIYSRLGGFLIALLLFGLPYMIKQNVGAGDLKTACSSALFLGFSSALTMFFTAFLSCSVYVFFLQIYAIITKKAKAKELPFAPFLLIGAIYVLIRKYFP